MTHRILVLLPALSACVAGSPPDVGPCANAFVDGAHSTLVVATSTPRFDAGTLSLVDLDSLTVCDDVASSTPDSVVAVGADGMVVDIGRLGTDRLSFFAAPEFSAPQTSFSVGRASNPQGAVWCGAAWWVPQLASPELRAFDLEGRRAARVDLSDYADADGIPEAADIVTDGSTVDVVLQRLNRDDRFRPTESGRIVRIGCEQQEILADAVTGPNPSLATRGAERVLLTEDGLAAWSGTGPTTPVTPLPHPAVHAAFIGSGHGVVVSREDSGWHHVDCVAPDGRVTALGHTDAFVTDSLATDRDRVWLALRDGYADPDETPPGEPLDREDGGALWGIDAVACAVDERVDMGLMPYSLAVY